MGTSAVAQLGALEAPGLSTTLPRRDVERAIKAKKGPPELIIDVTRTGDGETRSVAVQWTKADLEEVLRQSPGDTVTLTFKGEDLLRAFEGPEVEPHGVKEALAIAVTVGAFAGAGTAAASPADIGSAPGDPGHAAQYTAIEQARTQEAGTTPTWRSFEEAGARADQMGGAEAVRAERTATTPTFRSLEEEAAAQARTEQIGAIEDLRGPQAAPTNEVGISPDRTTAPAPTFRALEEAGARADQMGAIEQVRGEATTPQVAGMVPDTDPTGRYTVDPGAQPAGTEVGISPDRAQPMPATPTADTGGGISIEAPSPTTTGLIAGALGLAITAAAFAFDRRRRVRPQT